MRRLAPVLPLAWLWVALPQPAPAQVILLSCSVTATSFAFGSFDVLPGAAVATNGTLTVSCTNISLSSGNLYLCLAIPPRAMTGAAMGKKLAYDILGPTPSTASWSDTTPILIPFSALRFAQPYSINVQASVSGAQQTVPPDSYDQTLSATASYGASSCTSGSANSGTVTLRATATVVKSCNASAGNLSFGSVTSLAAPVDGQSALNLQCSTGTGYTVGLDGGLSGATDPTARRMNGGGESVTYGLYRDSARSLPWSASQTAGGTGTAATQTIPVYGRVPSQATPSPGSYSDTVVVTVTY